MLTILLIIRLSKYFPKIFTRFNSAIRYGIHLQLIVCVFLLVLIPASGFAQQYSYSVIKGSKQIGTLSVKCIKDDKKTRYSIWSEAKTGFIFNISINVLIEEVFEKGELQHSTFIRKIDGIEMIKNTVDKINKGYILNNSDDDNKILSSKVNYSMASMYFIEPKNKEYVYSENYQQFVPVIALGADRYQVNFPDGNKSYYTYRNGICFIVEAHTRLTVLFFNVVFNDSAMNIRSH